MSFDLPQTDFQISVWWAHCDDIRAGQRGAAHPRKNNRGPDYSPTGREQVRTPRRAFHWTGRRNNRDREAFGMTSLISSSCLEGNSSKKLDMPVIFAPGCTKLLTNPLSTGSLILIKTIGIVVVAFFTANGHSKPPPVTITSVFRLTNSAANYGTRSNLPPANRHSIEMFFPGI